MRQRHRSVRLRPGQCVHLAADRAAEYSVALHRSGGDACPVSDPARMPICSWRRWALSLSRLAHLSDPQLPQDSGEISTSPCVRASVALSVTRSWEPA